MLAIIQIVVSLILIVLILFQERSSGLSGVFGGGGGAVYGKRRGMEKLIFWGTIGCAGIFALLAVLHLLL